MLEDLIIQLTTPNHQLKSEKMAPISQQDYKFHSEDDLDKLFTGRFADLYDFGTQKALAEGEEEIVQEERNSPEQHHSDTHAKKEDKKTGQGCKDKAASQ